MLKKIIKVGNSLAVTLPAQFVKDANLKVGNNLSVEISPQNKALVLREKSAKYAVTGTKELNKWYKSFSTTNQKMLKELAEK